MAECMTFPDTVDEFIESYKVVDTEHVYSNGIEFVPVFRMKQWFEHKPERKKGKWIELDFTEAWEYRCDQCGRRSDFKENFCPNCGADNRGTP